MSHEFGHVLQSQRHQLPDDTVFNHLALLAPVILMLFAVVDFASWGILVVSILAIAAYCVKSLGQYSLEALAQSIVVFAIFISLFAYVILERWKGKTLLQVVRQDLFKGVIVFTFTVLAWFMFRAPAGWPARQTELAADVNGACVVGIPAMVSALSKLGNNTYPLDDCYDVEHPPMRERIARLLALRDPATLSTACAALKEGRSISEILMIAGGSTSRTQPHPFASCLAMLPILQP